MLDQFAVFNVKLARMKEQLRPLLKHYVLHPTILTQENAEGVELFQLSGHVLGLIWTILLPVFGTKFQMRACQPYCQIRIEIGFQKSTVILTCLSDSLETSKSKFCFPCSFPVMHLLLATKLLPEMEEEESKILMEQGLYAGHDLSIEDLFVQMSKQLERHNRMINHLTIKSEITGSGLLDQKVQYVSHYHCRTITSYSHSASAAINIENQLQDVETAFRCSALETICGW